MVAPIRICNSCHTPLPPDAAFCSQPPPRPVSPTEKEPASPGATSRSVHLGPGRPLPAGPGTGPRRHGHRGLEGVHIGGRMRDAIDGGLVAINLQAGERENRLPGPLTEGCR